MNNPSTCPHFSLCSGCEIPDAFHPPIWEEVLLFFRKLGIEPKLISKGFSHTRYKAKLAVGLKEGVSIGLYKKHSHEIIPIPHCLVHHPSINKAVEIIKEEIQRQKIPCYGKNREPAIRYLQCFVDRGTGKIQLAVVATDRLDSFCKSLVGIDLFHSIWLNIQPDLTNRILGDSWELINGEPFLWQKIGNSLVPFHPGAFSQAHLPLFDRMLEEIEKLILPQDRILELYAGVGAIGLNLREKAREISLVENNPYAYLSYQQTPKSNITYHCIDAKEAIFSPFDVTIVDPPRKGLDPEVLKKICSDRLIYISCGFASFQKDCRSLLESGWKIQKADGYLFFPGTNHVEILSLFEKT